ncbi:Alpha/Beta hydrolase protein [Xylariaceae sp. FL0255]|nr:Alpha/Beta hydrolase protein [Xylariaceae sp. FL0255]
MAPVWSTQPFKALYTAFLISKIVSILPWLLVRYSAPSTRPFPQWTLKFSVLVHVIRDFFQWQTNTRQDSMAAVISDHQKAKATRRYGLAEPADADMYSGVLAPGKATPASVGGLWYPAPLSATLPDIKKTKVFLHFPGGAFTLALGQEIWGKVVTAPLLKYSGVSHCFFPQYRVSVNNSSRFPAAVQDLLTSYNYVLSLGVDPKNVILSGDSAGGNLVLGLLRYMESMKAQKDQKGTAPNAAANTLAVPLPGAAMIWSPWVHVTLQAGPDFASEKNSANDTIVPDLLQWGAEAYYPEHEPTEEELAYISPLDHPFYTRVPLFIHAGTAEGFYNPVQKFANQMAEVEGNRIKFDSTEQATHDLIFAYDGAGREKDVQLAIEKALHFFDL